MREDIRAQYPMLQQKVRGQVVHYLDSAMTSLKPQSVIDAINDYTANYTANVHRGTHYFSELATKRFEDVREKVRALIGAKSSQGHVSTE